MKDFHEAVLIINVNADIAEAYKTAIESENHPNGLRDHLEWQLRLCGNW